MEISRRAIANAKTLNALRLGDKFIERNLISAVSLNTTNIFFLRVTIYVAFMSSLRNKQRFSLCNYIYIYICIVFIFNILERKRRFFLI